jgi:predicted O-methyltransferase YrrM
MSEHRAIFTALVKGSGWTRGAELGVDKGILFGMLLKAVPGLQLIGVDVFPDRVRSHRAFEYEQQFAPNAQLIVGETADAAQLVVDGSLDFVFIDADHSYEAVRKDIDAWRSKVRAGGWIGGHDYNRKFPGVVRAVDFVFGARNVITLPGSIWSVAS